MTWQEVIINYNLTTFIERTFLILLGHKIFIADSYCKVQHSMGIVAVIWRAR